MRENEETRVETIINLKKNIENLQNQINELEREKLISKFELHRFEEEKK